MKLSQLKWLFGIAVVGLLIVIVLMALGFWHRHKHANEEYRSALSLKEMRNWIAQHHKVPLSWAEIGMVDSANVEYGFAVHFQNASNNSVLFVTRVNDVIFQVYPYLQRDIDETNALVDSLRTEK